MFLKKIIQSYFTETKAIVALVLLLGLERLLAYTLPTEGGGRVLQLVLVGVILLIIFGLIVRYSMQFVYILKRLLPGTYHMIRSLTGLKSRKAPDAYVSQLFDEYANTFDEHLTAELGYKGHEHIRSIVFSELDTSKQYSILDLGCGTGLCAPPLKPLIRELVGIDLSSKMLAKAEERELYDCLICNSLLKIDTYFQAHFDLVISADVLVYFGELQPVFQLVAQALKAHGYFAFSVEVCEGDLWKLNRNGRYAHSRIYIAKLAEQAGFRVVRVATDTLRTQADEPVKGDTYLLQQTDPQVG